MDIILDNCDVVEVRLASVDVHHAELENQRQDEVVILQASHNTLQGQVDALRHKIADEDREAVVRAEARKARIMKLKDDLVVSRVRSTVSCDAAGADDIA